ncbi:SMP-30/gluconolactonase/LRE family protein [Parasedimentitalea psychrophila]|uniref:SMP-30/gluconolactonase/LRE family protein n=1 Tax=Parasedimentitalea psychrophila TaxID=2997337 RepID=A0A9Y2P695_9RHOB|nr:SMP-30/gluconolactonase/LRE family protein [Parasedimentitalea psychrophila]WIY24768.1 SMP-30/gluconolactonase/LRE family protein [Parasedimentitalea psychrophila]
MYQVEILQAANATLGEGPLWDARLNVLYWGDLKQNRIFRFDPVTKTQTGQWPLPHKFGCLALTTDPHRLAVVTDRGYELFDLRSGALQLLADPEAGLDLNCYNDGKLDPQGRFWVGSLPLSGSRGEEITDPTGNLYSYEYGQEPVTRTTGIFNTNGLCWSPQGDRFYHIDSWLYTVFSYDFDATSGAITNKQELIHFAPEEGGPDGMCIDQDGCLWIAMWDGWGIQKVSPGGKRLEKITLPVQKPTSCIFAGADLDELIITSASCYLDAPALQKGPNAGALLRVRTGTRGLASPHFHLAEMN